MVLASRDLKGLESVVSSQQTHRLIIHARLPVVVEGLSDDDECRLGGLDFQSHFAGKELFHGNLGG
jgi:hypothetical protein